MDLNKYKNMLRYPERHPRPILPRNACKASIIEYAEKVGKWEEMDKAFQEARRQYYIEEKRVMSIFQEDLMKELGILGHPKAQLLYDIAWSHGHSDGLHSVVNWAEELVVLIK